METNVGREVAALQRLTVKELRNRYAEVFGEETPAHNQTWLVRCIVWRLQTVAEGGLSERARRAGELACDADLRMNPPKVLAVAAPAEAKGMTRTRSLALPTGRPPAAAGYRHHAPLRRHHRRQHGTAGAVAAAGRHRGGQGRCRGGLQGGPPQS